MNRNQKAFTLVELLVVIAIIGVLGGAVVAGNSSGARSGAAEPVPKQPSANWLGDSKPRRARSACFPPAERAFIRKLRTTWSTANPWVPTSKGSAGPTRFCPTSRKARSKGSSSRIELQAAVIPLYVCPSRRSVSQAQVSAANLGGKQVFLIDYAAAQPCTVECPAGSPGCSDPTASLQPARLGADYARQVRTELAVDLGRHEHELQAARSLPGVRRRHRPLALAAE